MSKSCAAVGLIACPSSWESRATKCKKKKDFPATQTDLLGYFFPIIMYIGL